MLVRWAQSADKCHATQSQYKVSSDICLFEMVIFVLLGKAVYKSTRLSCLFDSASRNQVV